MNMKVIMKLKHDAICRDCGSQYDKKHKAAFGLWKADCGICGKKQVWCASASHDYGIYSSKKIEAFDKVQDLI